MDSFDILKYKWDCGIYSLKDMLNFVENGHISEEIFNNITRYNYKGVKYLIFQKQSLYGY